MKSSTMVVLCLLISSIGIGLAFAVQQSASVEKGKALFNDTKLGTNGNSCATCHPDGKGLEGAGAKKAWKTPAGNHKTLEEAINVCITMALKGKALDVKSAEMQSMALYIKSLGAKKAGASGGY